MKILPLLSLLAAAAFFSCNKERDREIGTPPTFDTLLTKVLYYGGDTSSMLRITDVLAYEKRTLSKIIATEGSTVSTYSFVYNANEHITQMSMKVNTASATFDYNIHYNTAGQIDSMAITDHSWPWDNTIYSLYKYSARGRLDTVFCYGKNEATSPYRHYMSVFYYRNASGVTDSILTERYDNNITSQQVITRFHASVKADTAFVLPQALMLMMASRINGYLYGVSNTSIYTHQFLNTDESFFRDGSFNVLYPGGEYGEKPFSHVSGADLYIYKERGEAVYAQKLFFSPVIRL